MTRIEIMVHSQDETKETYKRRLCIFPRLVLLRPLRDVSARLERACLASGVPFIVSERQTNVRVDVR